MVAWPEALHGGNAVLGALRGLFVAFAAEEDAKRSRRMAAAAREAIDPGPLREALAALPQGHRFRQGERPVWSLSRMLRLLLRRLRRRPCWAIACCLYFWQVVPEIEESWP